MDNTEKMVTFDTQDTKRRQTIHKNKLRSDCVQIIIGGFNIRV